MFIQVSRVGKAITGSYDGKAFGVTFSEDKYRELKELEAMAAAATTMDELKEIYAKFEPLTKESYKQLVQTKCPLIYVNEATGKFYLKWKEHISSVAMPQALVDRIIKSAEDGIEFLPLVKAWIRFLRNPIFRTQPELVGPKGAAFAKYINNTYVDMGKVNQAVRESGLSIERATELNTVMQTPITQEGLLVTYKVVRELTEKWILDADAPGGKKKVPRWDPIIDENSGIVTYKEPEFAEDRVFEPAIMGTGGDAFAMFDQDTLLADVPDTAYGHILKVGKRHALKSWDQVNTTEGVFGERGIHQGNLDYIRGYQNAGTVTLNVFVDPQHIGRFHQRGDGALIAKENFVYGVFNKVNSGIYHSSAYAAVGDKEYSSMLADILKQFGELENEQQTKVEQAKQLALDLEDATLTPQPTDGPIPGLDLDSPGNQA